ncbi:MAG: 30S ribosomal protein S17 [Planctomycetota bacterium]|nr:MAG: 30S ribosomal protein S17 [Planctomycetota bacterium]
MSQADAVTTAPERTPRKRLRGVVVSDKMDKTIVVQVERTTHHPRYHKVLRVRKKFHVHDQDNAAKLGDLVEIAGTRPLSHLKRWRLVQVLERAQDQ